MSANANAIMLENPYVAVRDKTTMSRVNADVPLNDILLIKAICPLHGILQTSVNLFIKALVDECRARNITSYNEYSDFVDIIRRRTAAYTPPKADESNVAGGVADVHSGTKKPKAKRTVS